MNFYHGAEPLRKWIMNMKYWKEFEFLTQWLNTLQLIPGCFSDYKRTCSISSASSLNSLTLLSLIQFKDTGTVPQAPHTCFHARTFACAVSSAWRISRNAHNLFSFLFQASAYQCKRPWPLQHRVPVLPDTLSPLPCSSPLDILWTYSYICSPCSPRISAPWGLRLCVCCSVPTPSIFNIVWPVFVEWSRRHAVQLRCN